MSSLRSSASGSLNAITSSGLARRPTPWREQLRVRFAQIVDRDDVRMLQGAGGRASRMKRSCASADRPSRESSLRATKRRMTSRTPSTRRPSPFADELVQLELTDRRYCSVCASRVCPPELTNVHVPPPGSNRLSTKVSAWPSRISAPAGPGWRRPRDVASREHALGDLEEPVPTHAVVARAAQAKGGRIRRSYVLEHVRAGADHGPVLSSVPIAVLA